ncbi:MAG TPA: DEAD/DEAH box helicase [Anaerolineales bacterium]|nr:DEAD/DEAH box helicase [Anaerolineales bacterium]
MPLTLTPAQLDLIQRRLDARVFLEGPVGCGKTTAVVERMLHLMAQGVPGGSILLLVPQRTLAEPYYQALHTPGVAAGGSVTVLTVGGLARRMVELFWPLVAEEAGFAHPERLPTFLTLETAQYTMAHLVRPLLQQGYFDSLVIDRNRLYSQIIDNLNKAAVVGFPHGEIGARLKAAWVGDPAQVRIYEDAQACADLFRQYCLEHNLLDFSLQLEVFWRHLWAAPLSREYLLETYRHLLVDNLEEDTPLAHDLIAEWLPETDSATLVFDTQAGYRRFLGADPEGGLKLKELCPDNTVFNNSLVTSPPVQTLGSGLAGSLNVGDISRDGQDFTLSEDPLAALEYDYHRFFPQMLDWVAAQIHELVSDRGVPPGEIVVLAPYLSDALRFALTNRLEAYGLPCRSHRPSRSLREEPVTRSLLTLAQLAHPAWELHPTSYDVAYTLMQVLEGMDLVRAQLLAEIVFRPGKGAFALSSFDIIRPEVQERITYRLGNLYERLRLWLAEYAQGPEAELDHFLARLFGELLSQPGYGFHEYYAAGEVTANLVESVQKFRWVAGEMLQQSEVPLGKEYLLMVQDGVIAAQYIRSWQVQPDQSVLLAPAYTFLLSNRPVDYQFWLDVGSRGWFERLYQPLTHPYVLSRAWPDGRIWTDADEFEVSQESLYRLVLGLLRRCRQGIYLGLSELGEQGYEQRGPLLLAFQRLLRHAQEGNR